MITFFIISLLFTVHDKIIMLMGTWRTTRENSATARVVWDALG
jgi:NADH:ubiquinone oxidoreductase subunit 3 (subunit A)